MTRDDKALAPSVVEGGARAVPVNCLEGTLGAGPAEHRSVRLCRYREDPLIAARRGEGAVPAVSSGKVRVSRRSGGGISLLRGWSLPPGYTKPGTH